MIALILCFSTLLGTTYAWFTDSVTSVDNIIKSGNLDIAMYWNEDLSNTWKDVEDPENQKIFDYDKWEPGYTEVRYIKIVNEGDLAFKYVLDILPLGSVSKLADVIDVYFLDPAVRITDRTELTTPVGTLAQVIAGKIPTSGKLENAGDSATVTIALKMREDAGNEYQGLSIGDSFTVQLLASQLAHEEDAFGKDYDENPGGSNAHGTYTATSSVETNAANEVTVGTVLSSTNDEVSAVIPEGVKTTGSQLELSVKPIAQSQANITVGEDENVVSLDVHVEGVADDNSTPIKVTLANYLPTGLNLGNHKLYHVEDGHTVEMTYLTDGATPVHNSYTYDPATGNVTLYLASFSEVTLTNGVSKWNGGVDYSWYDPDATRLTISSADQLAAFARIVGNMATTRDDGSHTIVPVDSFAGKVVKLACDIDLNATEGKVDDEGNPLIFYPVGYYNSERTFKKTTEAIESYFLPFEGVFDGGGHTISNFYQNTWEMKGDHNWYDASLQYYRDGMGLFGKVYGGTVKNLTVDNFSSDGEIATTGVIAAYADCGATFENITITNCNPRVYNIGNGGIVGCVGWYNKNATDTPVTFKNITVDNTNKISALWGSYDVACGGIVGQYYPTSGQESAGYPENAGITFEDCHVAAQMDVYNDVCANYQYYAYRYAGILLGSVRENVTVDGREYPNMDGITAKDCTVHFGTWNDYYYCELVANSLASYTHDHQMSRLEQVKSVDVENKKVTSLEGTITDIPTSGRVNYVVVKNTDANGAWIHGDGHDYADCYHFVNGVQHFHDKADGDNPTIKETVDGKEVLKEDKQVIYREFNNLVTGYGWGVTSKGVEDMEGVKILDEKLAAHDEIKAVTKFKSANVTTVGCTAITLGTLFDAIDQNDVQISSDSVYVSVKGMTAADTVTATLIRDTENWENSELTFSGAGTVLVTIQDYYYCTPTEIELTVTGHEEADESEHVFIGRVTAEDDPDGVGYELWAKCANCKEAEKIVANHEDGHHFDDSGNCKCGATATTSESITVAYHDFTTFNTNKTLTLVQHGFLSGIANEKWEFSATRPKYQSGSILQPAVSKSGDLNAKIVQLMQGEIEDNGVLKSVAEVYISFEIEPSLKTLANFDKNVFFSFRTTDMSALAYQCNEVELWAKVENGVMSVSASYKDESFVALENQEVYTVTLAIVPETNAYRLLLSGGNYNNQVLASGTMKYDLSNWNTAVFRSNDFSFISQIQEYNDNYGNYKDSGEDKEYNTFFAKDTTKAHLEARGAIYIDNLEFSCTTRGVDTDGATPTCEHNWTATAISGETDLYRYTCSECGYYFTGVKNEVVKVVEFASLDFDKPETQTHENLVITDTNNNSVINKENKDKHNINANQSYFNDGRLDITSNNWFYIAGGSVTFDLNKRFCDLMNGEWNGEKVDAVEMKFDLSYTGDFTETNLGFLLYQTKVGTSATEALSWLFFDYNDESSRVLYLYKNDTKKLIITKDQPYTVTLRWELNPTAAGKYITSFVVEDASGNKIGADQIEETSSFGNFNQMIFGRSEYAAAGNFDIFLDNLTVSYETAVDGIN